MKSGDIIGIVVISTVLVLLLKDPEGTGKVVDSGAKGFEGILSVLQGNRPAGFSSDNTLGGGYPIAV